MEFTILGGGEGVVYPICITFSEKKMFFSIEGGGGNILMENSITFDVFLLKPSLRNVARITNCSKTGINSFIQ